MCLSTCELVGRLRGAATYILSYHSRWLSCCRLNLRKAVSRIYNSTNSVRPRGLEYSPICLEDTHPLCTVVTVSGLLINGPGILFSGRLEMLNNVYVSRRKGLAHLACRSPPGRTRSASPRESVPAHSSISNEHNNKTDKKMC